MTFRALFGCDKLKGKNGDVDVASLEGKTVLIYFSAHWCPPCRQFTPMLSKFYTNLKEKRQDFEIVFASSDKDESQFNDYHNEMTFLALPFSEREAKAKLSQRFKVSGIPSLVVLDATGKLITDSGREMVMKDQQGAKFPWQPKSVFEILGSSKITNKEGKPITVDDLKKMEAFGLYFSAHWCPPCRGFTPVLAKTYSKLKADGKNFEIIFVSSDKGQKEFDEYHGQMPWAALDFSEREAKEELSAAMKVEGIPSFVMLNGADASVITMDARAALEMDPEGKEFPWSPAYKGIKNLRHFPIGADHLNEGTCVILDVNGSSSADAAIAEIVAAAGKSTDEDTLFFVSDNSDGEELTEKILGFMGMSGDRPAKGTAWVYAVNIPAGKKKQVLKGDIAADAILALAPK